MNATSPPSVIAPSPTASAPPNITAASAMPGTRLSTHSKWMRMRTRSIDESWSTPDCAANRCDTNGMRPNDLMARMPVAPSSTRVARSPWSSWMRRDASL